MQDRNTLRADKLKLPFLDDADEPEGPPAAPDLPAMQARPQAESRQRGRRRMLKLSALLMIALPFLLSSFYYGLIAADQFSVEVRFAVRGVTSQSGGDLLGVFAGMPGGSSTTTDTYIVLDYMKSREMLEKLEQKIELRKIFSRPEADWLARLDPTVPAEELAWYWRRIIKVSFDGASQIAWAEVRAFTPEDAKLVASGVLSESEALINQLSARARSDAVTAAQQEVDRMESRLKANRAALRNFREQQKDFDPVKNAESRITIVASIEDQLSRLRTKLSSLKQFMSDDAPSMVVLNSDISALERQLVQERAKLGKNGDTTASGTPLVGLVSEYEDLAVEKEFSEKAYVAALASLERARAEADRQQRYLAAFVRPVLPQEALYPKRVLNTLTITGACALLWALSVLIVYAIRDHAM